LLPDARLLKLFEQPTFEQPGCLSEDSGDTQKTRENGPFLAISGIFSSFSAHLARKSPIFAFQANFPFGIIAASWQVAQTI